MRLASTSTYIEWSVTQFLVARRPSPSYGCQVSSALTSIRDGRNVPMRYLVLLSLVCLVGCGSSSSSSVAPSPSPTPAPSPAPAPQPAPAPAPAVFPSMTGGWGGTLAITSTIRSSGARSSNTCNQTWIVTTQTGGDFSGTFQLSGGTTSACSMPARCRAPLRPVGVSVLCASSASRKLVRRSARAFLGMGPIVAWYLAPRTSRRSQRMRCAVRPRLLVCPRVRTRIAHSRWL